MRSKSERSFWKIILSFLLGLKCPVLSMGPRIRLKLPARIIILFLKARLFRKEEIVGMVLYLLDAFCVVLPEEK